MDQKLLKLLLDPDAPNHFPALIQQHNLTTDTIQDLKDYAAQFRFSDPAETMRIAQVAYGLSLHMSVAAQALGEWTLGNAAMHSGDFRQADQLFQRARDSFHAAENYLDAARMGLGHVAVLGYIGEPEQAIHLAQEIEPILEESSRTNLDDLERLGKLLLNWGNVYELLGQYEEALEIYQHQVPIAEGLGNQLLMAQAKHNQAYALTRLNAFEDARAMYDEAERLFIAEAVPVQLITLYINQVTLLVNLGQYAKAREIYQKAETQLSQSTKQDWQIYWLPALRGFIELQDDQAIEAALISQLYEAQKMSAKIGSSIQERSTWFVLGRCHLQRQEWREAKTVFTQLEELALRNGDPALQFHALCGLAQVSVGEASVQDAIEIYEAALQKMERMRHALYIEMFRSGFLTNKLFVYQELTALYLESANMSAAFQTVERAKARSITEKLAARVEADLPHLAQATDTAVHQLGKQLERVLQELEDLYPLMRLQSVTGDADILHTATAIATLEGDAQRLTQQIQRSVPRFATLTLRETASLDELAAALDQHTFLQYYTRHESIWVFVIDAHGLRTHQKLADLQETENARKSFAASVERLWELLSRVGSDKTLKYLPQLIVDAQRHLQRLYQLLIEPIAAHLNHNSHLTIAPDGPLYYIPFHALFDGDSYLMEHYVLSYIPNATSLLFCRQPHQRPSAGSLLIGYDDDARLAQVSAEIADISRCLMTNSQGEIDIYLQAEATTTHFLAEAARRRTIHLAAHAEFRADNPMLSSISLADRRLTLAEIAQLQLNADLVVLSGCETGQGRLYGSDSISLASGFLGAGARSLLVSLWRIEDRTTAVFMEEFYQAFLGQHSASSALATAQRWLLNCGRTAADHEALYAHPAYWAPFMVLGSE